jgi:hypothetical protein
MVTKRYISKSGKEITFPVNIKGRRTFVSVGKEGCPLVTSDESVQAQIEKNYYFVNGQVVIHSIEGAPERGEESGGNPGLTDLPEVTRINDAIDLLENPPYSVEAGKVKTVAQAKKAAAGLGICFPNLK